MANASTSYYTNIGNVSSLPWPYNPAGHFANLTGTNDRNHTTLATMVYLQNQLPTPPVWVSISWLVSFALTVTSLVSSLSPSSTRPRTAVIRKPGIIINLFRTGVGISKAAAARASGRIPSSLSVGALGFSLFTSVGDWSHRLDWWSAPALAAGVACWCLVVFQFTLDMGNELEYGYGGAVVVGGRCPRLLREVENCGSLQLVGCPAGVSGSASGELVISPRMGGYERIAGVLSAIYLPMGLGAALLVARLSVFRVAAFIYFLLMGFLLFLLLPNPTQFVDSMGSPPIDSNATAMNATFWSDCFNVLEPSGGSGFIKLWLKQEWNGSIGRAVSLFGLM